AHLFRLTCQYEKAEGLLLKLHQKAPRHSDINFQLATFYKITGNTSQSQKYCEQAKATSNNNDILRLSLLERVSQQLRDKHDRTNISMEHVLPEDVGLIKCFDAFSSIVDSRPSDAVGLLENVSFVDHIVEDLACVLKFHALTVNHHDVSHIQQHRINVLAKRGDRSLRNAIVAIRRGEYREAQQREAELILRAV
ncbi:MAG: hypothetical protein U9N87_09125, partial [Planctomycetota bacterium]|nr:hypothetical protein [Planctomycetota bacterium]